MNRKFELLKEEELILVDGGDLLLAIGIVTLAATVYGGIIRPAVRDQGFNDAINGR